MFNWIKIGGLVLALVFGLFADSRSLAAQLTGNPLRSPIPLEVPLDTAVSPSTPRFVAGQIPGSSGPRGRAAESSFGQASRFGDVVDLAPRNFAGSLRTSPAFFSGTFHSGALAGMAVVTSTGRLNMIEPQGLQTHLQLVAAPSQDGALSQMADQAEASSMMATPMDFTIDHADWPRVAVWSERAGGSTPATHFQKIAAIDRALDRTVTIGYLPTDPPTVVFVSILAQEEDLS